ncbi:MAG: phenylalanine--tRNA ligase subunit beta [Acidobacteriota bacterium]
MRICLSWISDFVDLSGHTPEELGRTLTMGIAEVEGVNVDEATGETVLVVDNKSLTHRPDLWGHVGIARELAAILGRPLRHPVSDPAIAPRGDGPPLSVTVEDPDLCPRYTAVTVENVVVGESPEWLKRRLTSVGMRPISNLVDLTNYVMLELGQPLHAFDIRKLGGSEIRVRRARDGESIVTLDGVARKLTRDDLLIADARHGVAIAGVMGSADSEIEPGTTTMVLESATFHPVAARRTAARLSLRTEAVMRFEKSLDPRLPPVAARRFLDLLAKVLPEARAVGRFHDSAPADAPLPRIALSTSFAARRLGVALRPERIDAILRSLEFNVDRRGDEHADVEVPSFRATKDVSIQEDLVEELGRIHGYGNIPPTPPLFPMETRKTNELRAFERRVKTHLASGMGCDEVMLYSFQSSRGIKLFSLQAEGMMKLANPLSEESAYLKTSLLPDALLALERNALLERVRFFELGRVYLKDDPNRRGDLPREEVRIAVVFHDRQGREGTFAQVKGAFEGLLARLGWPACGFLPAAADRLAREPWVHPGRAASLLVAGADVGLAAEVHPAAMKALGLKGSAAFLDFDLGRLRAAGPRDIVFQELPRYPGVTIDISLLAPERTGAEELRAMAAALGGAHLRESTVSYVYRGAGLPEGKKSVTLRLAFRSDDRTLTDAEVLATRDVMLAELAARGYPVR